MTENSFKRPLDSRTLTRASKCTCRMLYAVCCVLDAGCWMLYPASLGINIGISDWVLTVAVGTVKCASATTCL